MIVHDIFMILSGILLFYYSNEVIKFLSRLEWLAWSRSLNDRSENFKSAFMHKKGLYVKVIGIVLIFAGAVDILSQFFLN